MTKLTSKLLKKVTCKKNSFFKQEIANCQTKGKFCVWFGYLLFPVWKMRFFCMSLFFSSFDINFVIVVSEGVLFSTTSCAKWIGNWPMDLPLCFQFPEYFQMILTIRYWCLKWMLPKLRLIIHHVIIADSADVVIAVIALWHVARSGLIWVAALYDTVFL